MELVFHTKVLINNVLSPAVAVFLDNPCNMTVLLLGELPMVGAELKNGLYPLFFLFSLAENRQIDDACVIAAENIEGS